MSWVRTVAVAFVWTLLPGIGWGADLKFGLSGAVEYDDNIYRTETNKQDDVVFRITPKIGFLEDEGKLQWDLRYQAPWEKAVETNKVDGFYHYANAAASYHLDDSTQFFFNDSFSRADAVSRFTTFDSAGDTATLNTFREPVNRNSATLGVQHSFTPRLAGNLAFSNRLFQSDIPNRSNAMVYGANTNLVYSLSPHHRLGGGAAGTYQDFDKSNDGRIPSAQTFFLNVYGTWTWAIDETMTFQLTGGPTFVDTNQDAPAPQAERLVVPYQKNGPLVSGLELTSCGMVNGVRVYEKCTRLREAADAAESAAIEGLGSHSIGYLSGGRPPSTSDSSWTFFGEAALNKRWSPRLLSTLTYRRTDSTASGTGSATLDLVSLLTTWKISELWDVGFLADFTRRESTGPSTETYTVVDNATSDPGTISDEFAETIGLTARIVDRSLDTKRWGVSARMSRRITKHIYASLRYSYNQQTSKADTVGSTSDFSNHLVTFGVQYDFDRWHLW